MNYICRFFLVIIVFVFFFTSYFNIFIFLSSLNIYPNKFGKFTIIKTSIFNFFWFISIFLFSFSQNFCMSWFNFIRSKRSNAINMVLLGLNVCSNFISKCFLVCFKRCFVCIIDCCLSSFFLISWEVFRLCLSHRNLFNCFWRYTNII